MALSTYAGLQSAVARWLERVGDSTVTDNIVDWIALAEARINRNLTGRESWTDAVLTGTTGSRELALPTGFIEPRYLHLTTYGERQPLKPATASAMEYGASNGVPSAWCINGDAIDLDVPCNEAHTFVFRHRGTLALSDTATTNWLLTRHPDVYLWGTLAEAAVFTADARAGEWNQRFAAALDEVTTVDSRSEAVATLSVDLGLRAGGGFNILTG